MVRQQDDTDAAEIIRDVQQLQREHREQQALLGDVVDQVSGRAPDGTSIAYLSASLVAELRRRTGR